MPGQIANECHSRCYRGGPYKTNFRGVSFCIHCYDRLHRQCDDCGAEISLRTECPFTVDVEVAHLEGVTKTICEECFNNSDETSRVCRECDVSLEEDEVFSGPNNFSFCGDCFASMCRCCTDCSQICWRGDLTHRGDEYLCQDCARRGVWNNKGFYIESPSYTNIGSFRKFGVEIETSSCPGYIDIKHETVFGCKPDGSVDGMEFISPVLYGDAGLAEIRRICDHAHRLEWKIDSSCGLHLHVDLSSESDENCFKVAHAYAYTYDFWTSFISNARKSNYYCTKHFYNGASFAGYTDFTDWCENVVRGERYSWINWDAYLRLQTIELRHHSATLNGNKICNWVKAHTRFIDKVILSSKGQIVRDLAGCSISDQFEVISEWWDDDELSKFYKERAALFHKPIRRLALVGV